MNIVTLYYVVQGLNGYNDSIIIVIISRFVNSITSKTS